MPRMSRRLPTLLLTVLLAVLWLAGTARHPAAAQDDPETPHPLPQDSLTVVGLPFAEPFDTADAWLPSGTWTFDSNTAYDGSGWLANGVPRHSDSTLEYAYGIDLAGTLSAQLFFRQRGTLPPSDFVAVDLSLDGGATWFMIDQQVGLSAGWETRAVDLTTYRGQVIRLRFRLSTGAALEAEAPLSASYLLDNLAVQYVFVPQQVVLPSIELAPRTLLGLHLLDGAKQGPIIDLAQQLQAIGWPLGTLKGTTGTEATLNLIKEVSPETVTVYRSLLAGGSLIDCPNTHRDPIAEAQSWLAGLAPYWARVDADYYEIMNECLPPVEWLLPFAIEAMKIAGEQGQCLLLFSFSAGQPSPGFFVQLLPVFDYALRNPCASGRLHGIALHAYGLNTSTLVSESGLYLGFRHRLLLGSVLQLLPEALLVPVYLTEAGPGDGRAPFTCEQITRDVIQYTRQLEYDPYLRGFHLWNVGPSGEWLDASECVPMIRDALLAYYAEK
jgi:hypothetical protein